MGRLQHITIAALLLALTGASSAPARSDSRVPVLVELFTSDGCSSCPPANELLETFDRTQPIAGAELIVLSEHVDYWDNLGWKDPFSSKALTTRQYQYADRIDPKDGAYTPQLVIDGRTGLVGSDSDAAKSAIEKAIATKKRPIAIKSASRNGDTIDVRIQTGPIHSSNATLYVALATDVNTQHVLRGENAGRTLSHVASVRSLTKIGILPNTAMVTRDVRLSDSATGTSARRVVVFVQDATTGAVLAVASRSL